MAYSGSYGLSRSCRSYCNVSGYYSTGFSCAGQFCCGSANVRFCCSNSSLDISDAYPEKCRCALSSCSYLSWDVLLPCIAAALFVLLMVTICCCQGCRSCARCRQVIRRQCLPTNSATVSNGAGGLPATLEDGQLTPGDSTFPNLPPYEFGPPKYESLELAEAPPKYEDIVSPPGQQSEAHVNSAFVVDSSDTHDGSVTLGTVTYDSHAHDTTVSGASGPQQSVNHSRTSSEGPITTNSKVLALLSTDRSCQRMQENQLCESSLTQMPQSHERTQISDAEVSTSPRQIVCQETTIPGQVVGTHVDAYRELPQVVELTACDGRNQEHTA